MLSSLKSFILRNFFTRRAQIILYQIDQIEMVGTFYGFAVKEKGDVVGSFFSAGKAMIFANALRAHNRKKADRRILSPKVVNMKDVASAKLVRQAS